MAILVEILCVVIRHDAIERVFRGGWAAFRQSHSPNSSVCSDGELVRFGFMALDDAKAYISTLEAGGLVFHRDGQAVDLAMVHQIRGLALPAPWLEVGTLHFNGCPVVACWLAGRQPDNLAVPPGWKYEGSSSQHPAVEGLADGDRFKFLRRQEGVDVYLNLLTGKEVYVGRPTIAGETEPALFTQLEAISYEIWDLEAKMQRLQAARDKQGIVPLVHRLNAELLPEVERIAEGPGREMPAAHFVLGRILRMLHRREDAEQQFRRANALQPGVSKILLELVRCLGELNKHQEALPFARQAVEVAPAEASTWGNLAMCLIQCGEREEARKAINHAIGLDPKDAINRHIRDRFDSYFK